MKKKTIQLFLIIFVIHSTCHFQHFGLKGNTIVDVGNIGDAVLKSKKRDTWTLVDVIDNGILMHVSCTVGLLRDLLSRKVI